MQSAKHLGTYRTARHARARPRPLIVAVVVGIPVGANGGRTDKDLSDCNCQDQDIRRLSFYLTIRRRIGWLTRSGKELKIGPDPTFGDQDSTSTSPSPSITPSQVPTQGQTVSFSVIVRNAYQVHTHVLRRGCENALF